MSIDGSRLLLGGCPGERYLFGRDLDVHGRHHQGEYYSILLRCRRSFNLSIGLDEASCPGRGASPGINSALNALSARCLPGIENDRGEKYY